MIKHYLTIAWRNLWKYRGQSCISILSLAVGMVCFALSALWLRWELSYDNFWPDAENIYMVQNSNQKDDMEGSYEKTGYTAAPMGKHLKTSFPEVMDNCCCVRDESTLSVDSTHYNAKGIEVDSTFVHFFGIKVLEGNPHFHLHEGEIALTQSLAKRIFPNGKALGMEVCDNEHGRKFRVAAVVEDTKQPTSIPFDYMCSIDEQWKRRDYHVAHTFVKVKPENVESLRLKTQNDTIKDENGMAYDGERYFRTMVMYPNPNDLIHISKIRTETPLQDMMVSIDYLYFFMGLGVLVIVCGLLNYFTMLLTRIRMRQREIVLRYVNGAERWQLLQLFATELLIIMMVATVLALLITAWFLPQFRELCCIEQDDSFFLVGVMAYAVAVIAVSLLVTMIIIHIACGRQLQQSLGRQQMRQQSAWNHRLNLTTQVAVSLCTIFCAVVMLLQIRHLFTSPDMGYTKHNIGVLILDNPGMADDLRKLPEMDMVMDGYSYPLQRWEFPENLWVRPEKAEASDGVNLCMPHVSQEYCDMIGMQLLEGEMVKPGEADKILVNETAARMLGLEHPVGEKLFGFFTNKYYTIKGVVKDMYFGLPTQQPVGLFFRAKLGGDDDLFAQNFCTFRVKEGTNWQQLKEKVGDIQEKYFGQSDIGRIYNAEEMYSKMISSEEALARMLSLTTMVCILISVFGMFSAISLACERRRKEVALRKIHGAGTWDIYRLFLREYTYMLVIGGIIAFPVGYYLMHQWQMQYVRQAPVPLWLYPTILAAMALLIFLTVFWQIRKVAKVDAEMVLKE